MSVEERFVVAGQCVALLFEELDLGGRTGQLTLELRARGPQGRDLLLALGDGALKLQNDAQMLAKNVIGLELTLGEAASGVAGQPHRGSIVHLEQSCIRGGKNSLVCASLARTEE